MARPTGEVDCRRLSRSSAVVGIADGVVAVALPLLAAGATRDPLAVAGVIAAQHLPWVVVGLLGPLAMGNADRRTVLGVVHSLRAVALGLLGFFALAGTESIRTILVIAAVVGLDEALTDRSEDEAAGMLDSRWPGLATSASRRISVRGMLGLAIGLPLGGFLYEVVSALPLLLDVPVLAVAALLALSLRSRVEPAGVPAPAGIPAAAPGTAVVTAVAALATASTSAVLGVLVLFALDDLGLGAPAFGLLLAGMAASAAVGGLVAPEVGRALGLKTGLTIALLAAATADVAAAVLADPELPYPSVVALGAASGAAMVASVLARAGLHAAAGRVVEGGALRAFHLAAWAAIPVGAMAGGLVGRLVDVSAALAGAGAVAALAAVLALAVRRAPDRSVVAA